MTVEVKVRTEVRTEVETESEVAARLRPLREGWTPSWLQRMEEEKAEERCRLEQAAEERRRREEEERPQLEAYKAELHSRFEETLRGQGYVPPVPPPFLQTRALKTLVRQVREGTHDGVFHKALRAVKREIEARCKAAFAYLDQLTVSLNQPLTLLQKIKRFASKVPGIISRAEVSVEMPERASLSLKKKMGEIDLFLAGDWAMEACGGVLSVHVDDASRSTIIQIGIREHGPLYVTIPEILWPEELALKAIPELLGRLGPFSNVVDPVVVINGSHQGLNYNEVFLNARVLRAPSGNTERLALNMQESGRRERLSPDNTAFINSVPATPEEYQRVFRPEEGDGKEVDAAEGWETCAGEAQAWDGAVAASRFDPSREASREALVNALSESKNVIVVMAHCDGQSIFLPAPPPEGSQVDSSYLLANRERIAANAPFVYLFSCEAGKVSNLPSFAATLLECGASGVVASQTGIGSRASRVLLERILDEGRGAPPVDDYFRAMREAGFRDMEVFLA